MASQLVRHYHLPRYLVLQCPNVGGDNSNGSSITLSDWSLSFLLRVEKAFTSSIVTDDAVSVKIHFSTFSFQHFQWNVENLCWQENQHIIVIGVKPIGTLTFQIGWVLAILFGDFSRSDSMNIISSFIITIVINTVINDALISSNLLIMSIYSLS